MLAGIAFANIVVVGRERNGNRCGSASADEPRIVEEALEYAAKVTLVASSAATCPIAALRATSITTLCSCDIARHDQQLIFGRRW